MSRLPTPSKTLAHSQQAIQDDLNTKLHNARHVSNRLQQELDKERERGKTVVREMQQKHHQDIRQWKLACDALHGLGRIAALEAVRDLERVRFACLREMEATRKEKVARLQRDFKITLFQLEEAQLRAKNEELQSNEEALARDHALLDAETREQHEKQLQALVSETETIRAQLRDRVEEIKQANNARGIAQEEAAGLRADVVREQTLVTSLSSKLERAKLQLERAETDKEDFKGQLEEARNKNSELKRQLDDWDNLEKKSQTQGDQLRERCVELEVSIKAAEKRLSQKEKKLTELENEVKREQRRAEKLEVTKEDAEKEVQQRDEEIQRLQEKLNKLKSLLASQTKREKERSKSPASAKDEASREISGQNSEAEVEELTQSTKPPEKPRKPRKKPSPAVNGETSSSIIPSGNNAKAKVAKRKGKAGVQPSPGEDEVNEVGRPDSPSAPTLDTKKASKAPALPKSKRKGVQNADEEADAPDVTESEQPKRNNKRKEKAAPVEPVGEQPETKQTKKRKVRASAEPDMESTEARPSKRKTKADSASAVQPRETSVPESQEAIKKKKRRINVFNSQTPIEGLNWDFPLDGTNSMIPTVLSPIKETDSIPERSQIYLNRAISSVRTYRT